MEFLPNDAKNILPTATLILFKIERYACGHDVLYMYMSIGLQLS